MSVFDVVLEPEGPAVGMGVGVGEGEEAAAGVETAVEEAAAELGLKQLPLDPYYAANGMTAVSARLLDCVWWWWMQY